MPKLTTKRQITIPASICDKLGFEPGDSIQVYERDGVAHLVKMSDRDLAGSLVTDKPQHCSNILREVIKSAIKKKASNKFKAEHCQLPTANCQLPTANCQLPTLSYPKPDCDKPVDFS